MLAYAASRPRIAARQSSPNAMLIVVCAHIVVVAAVMSARMDLPRRVFDPPTTVTSIPLPKDPPPQPPPAAQAPRQAHDPFTDPRSTQTPTVVAPQVPVDANPTIGAGLTGGGAIAAIPNFTLPPRPMPVSTGARLLTPTSDLKPPYPRSKQLAEEEATLTLRLTIDDRGRVVAADPIGRADPVFLDAARRHLLARWRYQPATEDGRAVASTIIITLRFQLDG